MINITKISKRMMQGCLLLMLFLAQSLTSSAQVRLYMEDFSIASGEIKEVSLILDNDKEATVLQAALSLPSGLSYVEGSVAKTARVKGRGAEVQASTTTGKLRIVETDGTIAAGEGAVITFQVTANDNLSEGRHRIRLSEIIVSDANGDQLNTEESNNAYVTMLGLGYCEFTAPESIEVAANQEYQVDINLNNEGVHNLAAFQGKLYLPDGLEIVPGEDGKFIYTDRIPSKSEFKFQEFEGYTSFVLSSSNNYLIDGVDGVIFSFKVKAAASLPETTVIELKDLFVATDKGKSRHCNDITISVTNTSFEAYKADQITAIEALAEEGDSEATQQIITDAVAAIEAVEYDKENTSFEDYKAAVDEIVEPVAEALAEQRAADQLAADKAAFDEYKADLIAAVEALAEEGDSEDAQAIIADAKAAIEALEYDEEKTLEENKAAVDEIVEPVAEALAEQRAADQLAADKAAFDEYKAEQVEAVEALAEEGDSEEAQAIIADAVAAIEALEYDEEKTLEENEAAVDEIVEPVAEALAAQRAADQLAADKAAFDEYKAEQIEAVEALAAEGDSEAAQAIIADAKAAIEALEYDEEKSLEENEAAVDEIVEPVAEALAEQRAADQLAADKAAFDEYKADLIAAVEALAAEGDSEDAQAIIADAVAAIEALEYDEEKSLEENKAAAEELTDGVAEALDEQRAADQLAADKAEFDEYKADLIAVVEALAEEGDSEASQAIIADAVAAIEALEYDEEKTLEENEAEVDALVEPVAEALAEQRAADQLAADKAAFDEYKADLIAAVEALAEEGDSEASQQIIADAVAAIEALEYDEEKTLEENKAAAEELTEDVADALEEQRAADQLAADKAAFDEYKADLIAAVEALAEEGDSEASQQIIADAVAAIEALEYDEEKSLEENKAAAEELTDGVAEALDEQRAADAIIMGDVNGDGKINTVDASYILMYLVGNAPADFVEAAADVDGNGIINTLDATAILKMLVQ